jgi:hypothetical protein
MPGYKFMWPSKTKKHLQYESVLAWIEGEKIPVPFTEIKDEKLKDKYFDRLGELRRHLFDKHLKTLSQTERDQLKAGTHPSQSHEKVKDAKEFAEALHSQLFQHGLNVNVVPGCYHMDRVILSVRVDADVSRESLIKLVPQFYRGFEVHVGFIQKK